MAEDGRPNAGMLCACFGRAMFVCFVLRSVIDARRALVRLELYSTRAPNTVRSSASLFSVRSGTLGVFAWCLTASQKFPADSPKRK